MHSPFSFFSLALLRVCVWGALSVFAEDTCMSFLNCRTRETVAKGLGGEQSRALRAIRSNPGPDAPRYNDASNLFT